MSYSNASCRRCKNEIPESQDFIGPVVCPSCGWTSDHKNKEIQNSINKRFIKFSTIFSVLAIGVFIQTVNWDTHFISIIPLQIKNTLGMMSTSDVAEMAAICVERKNADCVEDLYSSLAKRDSQNIEHLASLGSIQFRRGKIRTAAATLNQYFAKGGLSLEASYIYARSLGQLGQIDSASSYYQHVLNAKPEVLQISVAQNYVNLLMQNQRLEQARSVLEDIRAKGASAAGFMETDLQRINETLGVK